MREREGERERKRAGEEREGERKGEREGERGRRKREVYDYTCMTMYINRKQYAHLYMYAYIIQT